MDYYQITKPFLVVLCYILFLLLVVATVPAMTFATVDSSFNQPEPGPEMQLPPPLQPFNQPEPGPEMQLPPPLQPFNQPEPGPEMQLPPPLQPQQQQNRSSFTEELEERFVDSSPRHLVLNLTEQITFQEDAENAPSPFELTISSDQKSANIVVGGTAQATLTIGLASGNTQPITLSCNLSPVSSETSCDINPSVVTPTGTATLTITTKDTISPGQYTAAITATPERGINQTASFVVYVEEKPDNNPPVISLLSTRIQVNASGSSGAQVHYQASATDDIDGSVNLTCTPTSGSTFPIGNTRVICKATDSSGNPVEESFTVIVNPPAASPPTPRPDRLPPVITVPEDITRDETTSPNGVQVPFEVSAQDNVDGSVEVSCDHNSGSTFPIGETVVTCEATDSSDNSASKSFTITVAEPLINEEDVPPVIIGPSETPIEVEATSNAGQEVSFTVTAADREDGNLTPRCDPPSGSVFRIGETVVRCNIVDDAGNTVNKDFPVIVRGESTPNGNILGPMQLPFLLIISLSIVGAIVVIVVIILLMRRRRRVRTDVDDEGTRVY